jgi:methylmalonyl-CoA mutase N-terminal domain/subunit
MSDIASGKEVLLGTNKFPDINEKVPSGIDLARAFKSSIPVKDDMVKPIRLFRGSEENERLRLKVEKGINEPDYATKIQI